MNYWEEDDPHSIDWVISATDRQFWNPEHAHVEEALSLAMDDIADKELFYLHVKEGSYARVGEMLGDAAEKRIAKSWQDLYERLHRARASNSRYAT